MEDNIYKLTEKHKYSRKVFESYLEPWGNPLDFYHIYVIIYFKVQTLFSYVKGVGVSDKLT